PFASTSVPRGVSTIRSITALHAGQRRTTPGAIVYPSSVPTSPSRPHAAHLLSATVRSAPKSASSIPATAFASSVRSSVVGSFTTSSSFSRRAEPLGADPLRRHADTHETVRGALHQRCRPADIHEWRVVQWSTHLGKHRVVDAAGVARPAGGLRPRERVQDLEPVVSRREVAQLVRVDD